MKAAVLHGACDIRTEEVADPVLESHGVIIKVKACGICGSDLHVYKRDGHEGTIFGHEFSGDVVAVGSGVADIRTGERVTAVGFRPCGQCFWCKQGKTHRCSDMALLGYQFPGAMAQYVAIPFAARGRNVFPLPADMTYEEAASVEPLSISYFSVRKGQPSEKDTAAVLGAGVIGLNAIQVLKAMGVSKVLASGRRPSRLQAAKACGADLVVDAAFDNVVEAIAKGTDGMGVNIVVECAGKQQTFDEAIDIARGGGKVLLVGVYEQPLSWDPLKAMGKNITLVGCLGGNFPASIDLICSGKVNVKPYITHSFPLEEAAQAFRVQLEDKGAIKVMLKP